MEDRMNETADWLDTQIQTGAGVELEIGSLIAAASDWTEDELELDDWVAGLVETDCFQVEVG